MKGSPFSPLTDNVLGAFDHYAAIQQSESLSREFRQHASLYAPHLLELEKKYLQGNGDGNKFFGALSSFFDEFSQSAQGHSFMNTVEKAKQGLTEISNPNGNFYRGTNLKPIWTNQIGKVGENIRDNLFTAKDRNKVDLGFRWLTTGLGVVWGVQSAKSLLQAMGILSTSKNEQGENVESRGSQFIRGTVGLGASATMVYFSAIKGAPSIGRSLQP